MSPRIQYPRVSIQNAMNNSDRNVVALSAAFF